MAPSNWAPTVDLVADRLRAARLIATARAGSAAEARAVGAALVRRGLPCLQLVDATPGVLKAARTVDGLLVGAADVRTPEQAAAAAASAHFATAPATDMAVVHACWELGLPLLPGVTSPTEIERLRALGIRLMRLVPAMTPSHVALLVAAYPDVGFVAGGVHAPKAYLGIAGLAAVETAAATRLPDRRTRSAPSRRPAACKTAAETRA